MRMKLHERMEVVNYLGLLARPQFFLISGYEEGLGLSRILPKKSGLDESLGKASWAHPSFGSSRWVPMTGRISEQRRAGSPFI